MTLYWTTALIIFATVANVATAILLVRLGQIGRRRDKIEGDLMVMLYDRIVKLERAIGLRSDTPKH